MLVVEVVVNTLLLLLSSLTVVHLPTVSTQKAMCSRNQLLLSAYTLNT